MSIHYSSHPRECLVKKGNNRTIRNAATKYMSCLFQKKKSTCLVFILYVTTCLGGRGHRHLDYRSNISLRRKNPDATTADERGDIPYSLGESHRLGQHLTYAYIRDCMPSADLYFSQSLAIPYGFNATCCTIVSMQDFYICLIFMKTVHRYCIGLLPKQLTRGIYPPFSFKRPPLQ